MPRPSTRQCHGGRHHRGTLGHGHLLLWQPEFSFPIWVFRKKNKVTRMWCRWLHRIKRTSSRQLTVAGTWSSWRPPWFDTMMPAAPSSIAIRAAVLQMFHESSAQTKCYLCTDTDATETSTYCLLLLGSLLLRSAMRWLSVAIWHPVLHYLLTIISIFYSQNCYVDVMYHSSALKSCTRNLRFIRNKTT